MSHFPDNLPPGWRERLAPEAKKPYFTSLAAFLREEHAAGRPIFPKPENRLRALQTVDYDDVKVVILGQDPYHGAGQAVGLSFAVPNSLMPKPPSLKNIFNEITSDLGVAVDPRLSELQTWASQGVLLLNTVLTVRQGEPLSHRGKGWETFTDEIIRHLGRREDPVVFLLWGSPARAKKNLIEGKHHRIFESAHPSPLSAHKGFFGTKPFSRINECLVSLGKTPIEWAKTH